MKSYNGFTINIAKSSKRYKREQALTKVSRLCKGIVVREDGEFKCRVSLLDDQNNPSFVTIPFTFDSYDLENRELVFEKNRTNKGRYICHIRDKYKARSFPGSKEHFIPFYNNVVVVGNIVRAAKRLHFCFKDVLAFSPTSNPIKDYNIDESKPLFK